jgi:hypothetical protein
MAKERQMLSVVEEKGKRKRVLAARGRRWVRARVSRGLKGRREGAGRGGRGAMVDSDGRASRTSRVLGDL